MQARTWACWSRTEREVADGDGVELRIAPVTKWIGDSSVRMLAYNGSIPGPTPPYDFASWRGVGRRPTRGEPFDMGWVQSHRITAPEPTGPYSPVGRQSL